MGVLPLTAGNYFGELTEYVEGDGCCRIRIREVGVLPLTAGSKFGEVTEDVEDDGEEIFPLGDH